MYGGDFNLFSPKTVEYGHEEYNLEVMMSQFRYFGPFPAKVSEIMDDETIQSVLYLMELNPPETLTQFTRVTTREVAKEDKDFICKMMQMDWRDRPTAKELLEDAWFDGED